MEDSFQATSCCDEDVEITQAIVAAGIASRSQLVALLAADRPYLQRKIEAFVVPHRRALVLPYCAKAVSSWAKESSWSFVHRLSDIASACRTSTGTDALDKLLCGGVCSGHVTELVGAAGVGKTQLVLQMLVVASAARNQPVFLFASESFPAQRLNQLAQARTSSSSSPITAADVLSMIFIRRISSVDQLKQALADDTFLQALRSGSPLVVLDSVAALVSTESDGSQSYKAAGEVGAALRKVVSIAPSTACLVTNQVRASFAGHSALPALGLTWAQLLHTRIDLRRAGGGGCRVATVVASPHIPPGQCHYQIDNSGVVAHAASECCF